MSQRKEIKPAQGKRQSDSSKLLGARVTAKHTFGKNAYDFAAIWAPGAIPEMREGFPYEGVVEEFYPACPEEGEEEDWVKIRTDENEELYYALAQIKIISA